MNTTLPRCFSTDLNGETGLSSGKFLIFITYTLLLCVTMGCQGRFPDKTTLETPISEHQPYTLGPGDKVRITVYKHENLSGVFTVNDMGMISLPLIRGVMTKGLTLPELEQVIIERLSEEHIATPKVSIDMIELRSVCVLGEVRNPGCFSYTYGMTASKAIAQSGGYTYRARRNEFVITRENKIKVIGNHDTPISAGDVIEVYERYF